MLEYDDFSHYGTKIKLTMSSNIDVNFIIKINNSNKYYLLFFNNDIIKLYKLGNLENYNDITFYELDEPNNFHIINILSGEMYWIRFCDEDRSIFSYYGNLYILDDNFKPDDVDNIINYCELIDNINLL